MLKLPGYHVRALLHRGAGFTVYRGTRDSDALPVIVKVPAKEYPSLGELTRLKQEYEVATSLGVPGVVSCCALEKHRNALALIMKDSGGASLDELAHGAPLELGFFLAVAIKLAETLALVHEKGIIHKDLRPANIVATRDAQVVEIINFGVASLLSTELQREPSSSSFFEGTLTHISPEQTGRINRNLDHRSDLYSLGITFYEVLTGQLPFQSSDPLEMLHWHLARTPLPASRVNPSVPEALSGIVSKLLAKTPEERYRTAAGLKADLERCRAARERGEVMSPADIGKHDRHGVFQIPQKLYGRAKEVQALLDVFDRVCAGPPELLLVSGYSGIGKSSLVHEVHKPIVAKKGNYVAGKFDQYKRNVPYASFVQAFDSLIQQVLAEDPRTVEEHRQRLSIALGANARLLIDVIPQIELILGEVPEIPKLYGADAQRRFNETFRSFIRVFTDRERPLVIFLDDLQWADRGTLSLIHLFMTDPEMRYLLLIGAYRDNEVSAHHPMCTLLEELRAAGARISEVVLRPFAESDIQELVADTLPDSAAPTEPLARLVMQKTLGNPFFVGQLLRSLHQEGFIRFDFASASWHWDTAAIAKKDYTENVVDLMAGRIQSLDQDTQSALKIAACIGNTFDLKTLAKVHGKPLQATALELWRALQESLVVPMSEAYKIPRLYELDELADPKLRALAEGSRYKFLHDRVQQAAYSLIRPAHLKSTHLEVGRLWLRGASQAEVAHDLFEIVGHLNAAIELITDPAELYHLVELNTLAARKAKDASAFGTALQFMTTVLGRLPAGAFEENYRVALACYLEAAEAELLNGRNAEAISLLNVAERYVVDVLDRCRLGELKVLVYRMMDNFNAAFATGQSLLKLLGVSIERFPSEAQLHEELAATSAAIGGRRMEDLAALPPMTDPLPIAACRILQEMWSVGFFLGSLSMHVSAMKIVQISAQHGNVVASVFGYMIYAFAQSFFFGDIAEGYQTGLVAMEQYDRLQCREIGAKVLDMWGGLIQHNKEPIRACRETLRRGFTIGMEVGDYQWAGYCGTNHSFQSLLGDTSLSEAVASVDRFMPALRDYLQNTTWLQLIVREAVASLAEDKPEPLSFTGAFCDEKRLLEFGQQLNDLNVLFHFYLPKLAVAVLFGATESYLFLQAEAQRNIPGATGIWINRLFYFFQGLAFLELHDSAAPGDRAEYLATAQQNIDILERRSKLAPRNFAQFVSLLRAEQSRIEGRGDTAMRLYDQAIAEAKDCHFLWVQALASERAAHFYERRGARTVALAYRKDARHVYLLWGAHAKVRKLDETYPELAAESLSARRRDLTDVDMIAVTRASQAISGELVLGRLLATLMRIVLESAGAQSGQLLLAREDGALFIEALSPTPEGLVLPLRVEGCELLPRQLVRYVAQAGKTVLLEDAAAVGRFTEDPYIRRQRPRSVLCLPILRLGRITGLLYLENNLIKGAFTLAKVRILEVLAAQAAISIENARLYDEVEQRVAERTAELVEAQRKLVDTAHRAGMAEIATNVLHNVGNSLSSVNVSATMIYETLQRSSSDKLIQVADLLLASGERLAEFMSSDRGRIIPAYLKKLGQSQQNERSSLLTEFGSLQQNVRDIHEMLKLQQAHATAGAALVEKVQLQALIDNALKVGLTVSDSVPIEVKKQLAELAPRFTERYKVQQILVNLITNAVHAVRESSVSPKVIAVRLYEQPDGLVCIEVADNGMGIRAENMTRIFEHGFTTRKNGHGFGLHASANAAREMGGSLSAQSEGPGLGARFRLELPMRQSPS
ncbi:MAG TPA: AAA family ATPase [Pseudomonadota bacterium]|nr:AAA family ATPase [Pseudomonadota bacterium]